MSRKKVCDMLSELIADEAKAPSEYYRLLDILQDMLPETRNPYFSETFIAATAENEVKHRKLLERLSELIKCQEEAP